MINDRRDEAISHSHDGVRDEYIKHLRHTHVADCMSRFACNSSGPLGAQTPPFLPRGLIYAQSRAVIVQLRAQVGAGACALCHGQPLRAPSAGSGWGSTRSSGARGPSSGRARGVPNAYLKRRRIPAIGRRS